MRRILRITAIIFCLVLLICAGIVDARSNDDSGYLARFVDIKPGGEGDVVFIGETNLNFEKFKDLSGLYDELRLDKSNRDSEKTSSISLKSPLTDISSKNFEEGYYYLYNSTSKTFDRNRGYVYFVNPKKVFSEIVFSVMSEQASPLAKADGTEIPALSQVRYSIRGEYSGNKDIKNVMQNFIDEANELGWMAFDFHISVTGAESADTKTLRSVISTDIKSERYVFSENVPFYKGGGTDKKGFFTYNNLDNRGNNAFPLEVEITFDINGDETGKVGLEGLDSLDLTATQIVKGDWNYKISPNPITITEGGYVDLTLTGVPYQTYQLYVLPYTELLYLGEKPKSKEESVVTVFPTKSTYSADDDGNLVLYAEEGIDDNNEYSLVVNILDVSKDNREVYSEVIPITVAENKHKPTLTLSEDVKSGQFSVGDVIRFTWGYEGKPYVYADGKVEEGSLYLEGMNYPKTELMKDTPLYFTDSVKVLYLDTTGLDAGSYTLSLEGDEHTAEVAFYLNTPLLTASLSGGSQGTVVQGSKLQINWNARGSPNVNYTRGAQNDRILTSLVSEMYQGDVQWYIFGTNYVAADNATFSLIKGSFGVNAPNGEGKHIYPRSYTESLSPGTYYVIVQHPGADKFYSLKPEWEPSAKSPDRFPKSLIDVNTYSDSTHTKTGTLNVADKQAANAAEMIRSYLNNGKSDDLYVQLQFQVEAPWFTVTNLQGGKVGDTISISGETNYPEGDIVSLTITPVSFTPQQAENSQMQLTAYYESNIIDTGAYNRRTFAINGISTNNWYPGTYTGKFKIMDTNEDTEVIKTMSFVVGADGIITTPDISIVDTSVSPSNPVATPFATQKATGQSTTAPTSATSSTGKSPAPMAGVIIGLVAAAYGMLKLRR